MLVTETFVTNPSRYIEITPEENLRNLRNLRKTNF